MAFTAKKEGLQWYRITLLGTCGVLVSRLSSVMIDAQMSGTRLSFGLIDGTGAFFWALIPGLAFAVGYSKYYGLPVLTVLDCLSPALLLAQAIGRLGCFAAGCCFGKPTTCALGVVYRDVRAHNISHVPLHVPLHPTQLYESASALLVFVCVLWLYPRRSFSGQIFAVTLAAVSGVRIIFESFRGDTERGQVFGLLSLPRFVALLLFLVAVALFAELRRRDLHDRSLGPGIRNV